MQNSLHEHVTKVPLLLFSGGLDSTFNLWCRLERTPVDVLYAFGGQSGIKAEAEKKARQRLMELLHKTTRFKVRKEIEAIPMDLLGMPGPVGLSQPPAWLFAALKHVDPETHSSVEIAYVLGDDALMMRHEIQAAWDNLCLVAKGVKVPLTFPLMRTTKQWVLKHMTAELLEAVWVCEKPKRVKRKPVACGTCHPCLRHKNELAEFELKKELKLKEKVKPKKRK